MRTLSRLLATMAMLLIPVLYSSCGDGGGGGTGPGQPPAETLASFELTVPDSIAEGTAFSLTVVAVGNRGTNPLTSYSGTVSLSTTLGTINPSSLTISSGTGSGQVTLSTPGQQTLTASGGGRTGSVGLEVTDLPEPVIPGDPGATVEQAVQFSAFEPRAQDYSNDHPDLPGVYLSHNTILLAFQVGTTVEQANTVLQPLGAELAGANQGVSGVAPSVLILRLPTETHADLEQTLTTLRSNALVLHAVQDVLLEVEAVSDDSHTELGWEWEVDPTGGNWGLELSRVPQMWNLNRGVEKSLAATGLNFSTGIVDVGFVDAHEDLDFENLTPGMVRDHGTHVAGIIGAGFGNGRGIDGMNPFADMVVMSRFAPAGGATVFDQRASLGESYVNSLIHLALTRPKIMVLNLSLGYNWTAAGIDANNTQQAKDLAALQGSFMILANTIIASARPLPMIVTSAGNDSGGAFGIQDAKWGSPVKYAGLALNAENVLVVENVAHAPGRPGDATRWASSNIGGHISAPGTNIQSTVTGNSYGLMTGTSMAAPHVAGLIGYMLAVDPTLTIPQIRAALLFSADPVDGGASARMDAWAAVMEIDQVQGDERVLKMMLDIDDGTVDGNQRVDYDTLTFPDLDSLDVDEDGGLGDGKVDMSDFRVWRDWYLKIWESGSAQFDGRDDHPKMDVNDNGVTEDDAGEAIYPRGDFNGDGILSLEDSARVFGAVRDSLSDLDVFKLLFDDPDYDKEDLDTLVQSIDIRVDASSLFDLMGISSVDVWILEGGPPAWSYPVIQFRTIYPDAPEQVFTLRHDPKGYRAEINVEHSAYGTDNLAFGADAVPAGKELGADLSFRPIWGRELSPQATYTSTCEDPDAQDAVPLVLADWGIVTGDIIVIDAEGFFWSADDERSEQIQAVFSKSAEIQKEFIDLPGDTVGAPPKKLVRRTVTDAIEAGNDVFTPPPDSCSAQVADIPEDFSITPRVWFQVPDSATHLFVAARSGRYGDNEQDLEDPLEVSITVIYVPEWDAMIQRASKRK